MAQFEREIAAGERFRFGRNWCRFLNHLDESRIAEAEQSLRMRLNVETLAGQTFLDIGCGSGLFSLAARRLGALVHSFDFDTESVACAVELRSRFFPDDEQWTIEQGSALDRSYLESLGEFDIVYSWGVLHHTGSMEQALENAPIPVSNNGKLFLAIYNDQGLKSDLWRICKRCYCRLPSALKLPVTLLALVPFETLALLKALLLLQPQEYVRKWTHTNKRGMNRWHDFVDWLGGYPFEVARPEEIVHFYRHRGFVLDKLATVGGRLGCNEFVLCKLPAVSNSVNSSAAATGSEMQTERAAA